MPPPGCLRDAAVPRLNLRVDVAPVAQMQERERGLARDLRGQSSAHDRASSGAIAPPHIGARNAAATSAAATNRPWAAAGPASAVGQRKP